MFILKKTMNVNKNLPESGVFFKITNVNSLLVIYYKINIVSQWDGTIILNWSLLIYKFFIL